MANEDYKSGKLVEIVKEFDNTGNRYEINGIIQSIAVPFWRIGNGKFNVIPKGDYRFISESGNNYMEIMSGDILNTASQFQIVYINEQKSSKYEEDFPDINILVSKYNELVEDATRLFSYLKSVGMISDTLQMTKVLSQLEPLTTWYMNEQGIIETLPISELYQKFNQMINALHEEVKKLITKDYEKLSQNLKDETNKLLKNLSDKADSLTDGLQNFADKLEQDKKAELDIYISNTLKPNLNSFTDVKKTEIEEVKTQAVKDITIQENSSLQNILSKESEVITAVGNKGDEEKKELEDLGIDIKTQLELLLENADIANLQTLIGNCYKGMYSAFNTYYSGDIYYKKETAVISLIIPDRPKNTVAILIPSEPSPVITKQMTSEDTGTMSSPVLAKESTVTPVKKFYRLYGDVEREYNFTDNGDNKVVGFALGEYNRLIRTNSTIEFELNTINYTVAINIPDTEITDLAKSMTTEQDNSAVTIIKKQTDLPLYTLDTQREPVLRKINY